MVKVRYDADITMDGVLVLTDIRPQLNQYAAWMAALKFLQKCEEGGCWPRKQAYITIMPVPPDDLSEAEATVWLDQLENASQISPLAIPCECCGCADGGIPYGEPDATGTLMTHYKCHECLDQCSSDEEGNPVHMLPGWDGKPETFEAYRAKDLRDNVLATRAKLVACVPDTGGGAATAARMGHIMPELANQVECWCVECDLTPEQCGYIDVDGYVSCGLDAHDRRWYASQADAEKCAAQLRLDSWENVGVFSNKRY